MIYIEGNVTLDAYLKKYPNHQSMNDKNIVFVFPGNPTHHAEGMTMFTIKGGGGLAFPAQNIGKAGFPVLSLPTLGVKINDSCVQSAKEELYKAIAMGYRLMIPIREHRKKEYFDAALTIPGYDNKEPNFWGGVVKEPNKELANMYTSYLNDLILFTEELCYVGEDQAVENLNHRSHHFATVYKEARKGQLSNAELAIKELQTQLANFKQKAEQLKRNNQVATADIAIKLHDIITQQLDDLLKNKIDKNKFRQTCDDAIKNARPVLDKFGCKELLINLGLAILGLGVIYAVACSINKAVTGHFLFGSFENRVGRHCSFMLN